MPANRLVPSGSRLAAASTGDLGEHGHGVVRRAGEQRDAHGEQHAAEQGLVRKACSLAAELAPRK